MKRNVSNDRMCILSTPQNKHAWPKSWCFVGNHISKELEHDESVNKLGCGYVHQNVENCVQSIECTYQSLWYH